MAGDGFSRCPMHYHTQILQQCRMEQHPALGGQQPLEKLNHFCPHNQGHEPHPLVGTQRGKQVLATAQSLAGARASMACNSLKNDAPYLRTCALRTENCTLDRVRLSNVGLPTLRKRCTMNAINLRAVSLVGRIKRKLMEERGSPQFCIKMFDDMVSSWFVRAQAAPGPRNGGVGSIIGWATYMFSKRVHAPNTKKRDQNIPRRTWKNKAK